MGSLAEAPVVAHVVRDGFVESVHRGLGVVTSASGEVEFAVGDPWTMMFPRSANKPLHAVAAVMAGAKFTSEALALACASHAGSQVHVDGVRTALASVGLGEEHLRNTPGLPLGEDARAAWLRGGRGPEPVVQCCSGNHAGMLAASLAGDWGIDGYLEPDHPFQRLARATSEELAAAETGAVAVDGCGTALFAMPLIGLARAYGRIAAGGDDACRQVARAMTSHPELVSGDGRDATELMRLLPGTIAKDGAEAVFAASLPDGRGVAVKIADGGERAAAPVLGALLAHAGVAPAAALQHVLSAPVLGHGESVGAVVPVI